MDKTKRTYRKEFFLTLLLFLAFSLNFVYFDMFYDLGGDFKDYRGVEHIELLVSEDQFSSQKDSSLDLGKYLPKKTAPAPDFLNPSFKFDLFHFNRFIFHRFKDIRVAHFHSGQFPSLLRTSNISHKNQDEDEENAFYQSA